MALRIEPNAEPIPGYRLIERLGSGGFGEVWKAEAPGGLFKAIKFVQRGGNNEDACIGATEQDRSRADQEWKSLLRVKSVRHPFILLLDRFENIEDFLVIVMELADRTLADRFKECRSQGLPGIPRDELLAYMAEAAEVLDLMNAQHQLQHLDIKPQNLFLVHNHIKVADFGLVKDTTSGGKLMTITGGVTPVYAAPETFDGKFSRQSDQYSLGIVYQEMLTGYRPFTGTSMKQLILQHMQNAYDLTPAPVNDRPVLARALSRNPEDRFPTCVDLVQALKRAVSADKVSSPGIAPPPPPPSDKQFPSVSRTLGARGAAGPIKPADPNFSVERVFLESSPKPPPAARPKSSHDLASYSTTPARRKTPSAHELPGVVQPALVIGIGQLGISTLTQFKERLLAEFAGTDSFPHLRFLAIDTDPGTIQHATTDHGRASLRTHETYIARLQRPSNYLKSRDGKLPTDRWLNPKLLYRIPREPTGAGVRALGRLAFVDSYRPIAKRLEAELVACATQDTPHDPSPYCDLGLRSIRPRVYIISSLTGNTGSGMLLDIAYVARKLLNDQGHGEAEVVGMFYVPPVRRDGASPAALANTYATLTELQAFSQADAVFSADYETPTSSGKGETLLESGPAFQRCFVFTLPDAKGKGEQETNARIITRVGDFLYRDIATPLGQALDEQRQGKLKAAKGSRETVLESIGMYRIHWPRHAVLEQVSRRLCTQIAARWMSKDASRFADTIRQWTHERWESLGLRPESLIERFQQMSEQALQQSPEKMLAEILAPLHQSIGSGSGEQGKGKTPGVNMGAVVACMDRLEKVLGSADDARSAARVANNEPALMERALADIAHVIADDCEQKLAELAVTLLEDPNYRLAGAEEALRQFCTTVEQSLQSQETLAKELAEKAAQLSHRIQQLTDVPLQAPGSSNTQWALGKRRPASNQPSPDDVFELVRTYTKTRYHSLVLTHLNGLYVGLRGHLSDQIREVGFCRQRLGELAKLLQPSSATERLSTPMERALYPAGCLELKDAVEQVTQSVTPEDLIILDDRIQDWIREHCQALLQICMGSATLVRNLAPAMLFEAEAYLKERLAGASVAEMYWTQKERKYEETTASVATDDLQTCLDDATSELGKPDDEQEITLVSFPADEFGDRLKNLLQQRNPSARFLPVDRPDEIIFFHDIINIPWNELPQLGAVGQEIYQHRLASDPTALHTREDVTRWTVRSE